MKKIIILLIFFLFLQTTSLAASSYKVDKQNINLYQTEIENKINIDVSDSKSKIDKITNDANYLYNNYLTNKNNMKKNKYYIEELENFEAKLETIEFQNYLSLVKITSKYLDIENKIPITDFSGDLYSFIYPYLKKNKISNIENLTKLSEYIGTNGYNIEQRKNEIEQYSIEYENKKITNLENKYYKKFKDIDDLLNFSRYTGFVPNINDLYITRCRVIQILNNSFLAQTMSGNGFTILIQSNTANKLKFNDLFLPYLPIKYTGKTFSYKNLYGETRTTYIFREVYPEEYKKLTPVPQISESFYFVPKPTYSRNFTFVGLQNIQYPNANGSVERLYKKGY